jgi:hypothetical protein
MSAAGAGESADELGDGLGQDKGFTAEPQSQLVGGVEVLEGEATDRGWGLGVEQEE